MKELKHPNLTEIPKEYLYIKVSVNKKKKGFFGISHKTLQSFSLIPNSFSETQEIYQKLIKILQEQKGSNVIV